MARINVIDYEHSTGRLREIYDELIRKRGKLADIHTIQSLRPESIVKHMDLYLEIMFSRSELSRAEREMIAVTVSVANGCDYCCRHHSEALKHYWKDQAKLNALIKISDFELFTDREAALCRFARNLTLSPQLHEQNDYTVALRENGLSDAAILDTVLVVAYFNFVNRIALSTGLLTDADEISGYKY
jgi:uncharacterized peroxidase-related enzyme